MPPYKTSTWRDVHHSQINAVNIHKSYFHFIIYNTQKYYIAFIIYRICEYSLLCATVRRSYCTPCKNGARERAALAVADFWFDWHSFHYRTVLLSCYPATQKQLKLAAYANETRREIIVWGTSDREWMSQRMCVFVSAPKRRDTDSEWLTYSHQEFHTMWIVNNRKDRVEHWTSVLPFVVRTTKPTAPVPAKWMNTKGEKMEEKWNKIQIATMKYTNVAPPVL